MFLYIKHFILILQLLIISLISFGQSGNEILEYKTIVKIENNKLIKEVSYLIQINKKQSEWIANVEIPYNKNNKLDILGASIINSKGLTVRTIKKKEITTQSDISTGAFFEDNLIKSFTLRWNEYPYQIKYSYRISTKNYIYLARWNPVVYTKYATKYASIQVEIPKDFEVSINYSKNIKYHRDTLKESCIHYWEISDVEPIKKEAYSPPYMEQLSFVSIVPKTFYYGLKGSSESWSSFGDWKDQLIQGLDILTEDEKMRVNNLLRGITDNKEIIKTLYHYLQDNTRYIYVAIDIGGLKPYPASYVCDYKYGDCKALTIYMKALLKHVGIRSYYTTIYAGNNPVRVNQNLPSQQFNHVILCIPIGKDTIWLENTANYLPFNYLGTFTQNRNALLVNGEKSTLIKTPSSQLEEVVEKSSYIFNLDQKGNGQLTLSQHLKGDAFDDYKYAQFELAEKDQKRFLKRKLAIENYQILNWEFDHPNRDDTNIMLNMKLNVMRQFRKIGNMIVINPSPIFKFNFESPDLRKSSVRFNFPINKNDSIIYNLPFKNRYKTELPEDVCIETEYGVYIENYSQTKSQIILTRNLQLLSGDYTIEKYKDFYLFIDLINHSQQKSVIILNP